METIRSEAGLGERMSAYHVQRQGVDHYVCKIANHDGVEHLIIFLVQDCSLKCLLLAASRFKTQVLNLEEHPLRFSIIRILILDP